MIEIEYTTGEGDEWISARTEEAQFVRSLKTWADGAERRVDPERRIPIEIEGGNVVPVAAIRLPDGTIIDAIGGFLRTDGSALVERERVGVVSSDVQPITGRLFAYVTGNAPTPLPAGNETDEA